MSTGEWQYWSNFLADKGRRDLANWNMRGFRPTDVADRLNQMAVAEGQEPPPPPQGTAEAVEAYMSRSVEDADCMTALFGMYWLGDCDYDGWLACGESAEDPDVNALFERAGVACGFFDP